MNGFALITGAGGGLGKDAAFALAEAGVEGIVFADVNKEAAEAAANESKKYAACPSFKTAVIQFDINMDDEVNASVEFAVEIFGRIDYAVNAVGINEGILKPFADLDVKDYDNIHSVNTRGLITSIGAQVRAMKKQEVRIHKTRRNPQGREIGRGVIVNMVSAAGVAMRSNDMLYGVAKHAAMAVTKIAALDHTKDGIRINALCPSWVRSPLLDRLVETNPAVIGAVHAMVPWKRMAEPEEVSDAVVFLCGPTSSYMSGTYMLLDNGLTLVARTSP